MRDLIFGLIGFSVAMLWVAVWGLTLRTEPLEDLQEYDRTSLGNLIDREMERLDNTERDGEESGRRGVHGTARGHRYGLSDSPEERADTEGERRDRGRVLFSSDEI